MAQIILYATSEVTVKNTFTHNNNIVINSIENQYNLNINFSEGDTISAGNSIYVDDVIAIEDLEKINGVVQHNGFVTVEYTEI